MLEFTLTETRAPYLQETFIELYMNGFYTGLFFVTLHGMVFRRGIHRSNPGLFFVLVMMYMLATMHMICRWIVTRNAFINNGATAVTISVYLLQPPLWLAVLPAVVLTVNTLLADFVLIWRYWIIWNQNWVVVALPIMCTLSGAALGFKSIQEQAAYIINPNLDHDAFVDFATPYFSLSLATTCLATLLIVVRIITMSDGNTRKARGYTRVIEIVVESALLYSVAMAIFLAWLVSTADFSDGYAEAVVTQITGIAPTLIVARVSYGLARPDETWQSPISTLRMRGVQSTSQGPNSMGVTGVSNHSHASEPQSF
ncbi:hypothetical protein FB45DRAFT_1006329 [Roridomyces roridus]|uniref:Uncharacterized protein n=1 Tax=Roridomyces roridus TaxID=1738132 RepID=A0AAD7BIR5_9AGAR|nr:hypothetical protein FB45DRAFT_1006329 [Roridomyces roridus]